MGSQECYPNDTKVFSTNTLYHQRTWSFGCRWRGNRCRGNSVLVTEAASLTFLLRLEVVVVAPAAAVHELRTLLLHLVMVPAQRVRVALARLTRLAARLCNHGNGWHGNAAAMFLATGTSENNYK